MPEKLLHILLVDDSDEDNEFHEIAIKQSGLARNVTTITSAEAALSFLEQSTSNLPDLIFLDAMMPRINGFELIGKISDLLTQKNIELNEFPAIYLLSGSYNPEMDRVLQNKLYEALVKGYRIKPLTAAMVAAIADK
ncbi:MAG: response regulator [Chitinophagales bacterium]|nr:response regulator [Chitinophagales bacterium]